MGDDDPGSAAELAPLLCSTCGAPLAIGPAEVARCAFCGATTDVPAGHRALIAARAAPEALARATAAWRRYDLGVEYLEGQGVKQDYELAAQLFYRSCKAGHDAACARFGEMAGPGSDAAAWIKTVLP